MSKKGFQGTSPTARCERRFAAGSPLGGPLMLMGRTRTLCSLSVSPGQHGMRSRGMLMPAKPWGLRVGQAAVRGSGADRRRAGCRGTFRERRGCGARRCRSAGARAATLRRQAGQAPRRHRRGRRKSGLRGRSVCQRPCRTRLGAIGALAREVSVLSQGTSGPACHRRLHAGNVGAEQCDRCLTGIESTCQRLADDPTRRCGGRDCKRVSPARKLFRQHRPDVAVDSVIAVLIAKIDPDDIHLIHGRRRENERRLAVRSGP